MIGEFGEFWREELSPPERLVLGVVGVCLLALILCVMLAFVMVFVSLAS